LKIFSLGLAKTPEHASLMNWLFVGDLEMK